VISNIFISFQEKGNRFVRLLFLECTFEEHRDACPFCRVALSLVGRQQGQKVSFRKALESCKRCCFEVWCSRNREPIFYSRLILSTRTFPGPQAGDQQQAVRLYYGKLLRMASRNRWSRSGMFFRRCLFRKTASHTLLSSMQRYRKISGSCSRSMAVIFLYASTLRGRK